MFTVCSRDRCGNGEGENPIYVNVDMTTGTISNSWIDSLSAAWPGVQVSLASLSDQ